MITKTLPTKILNPGMKNFSSAERFGSLIAETMKKNPNFYLFSPDETTSNKIDAAYADSARAWNTTKKNWDLPAAGNGQIVELLSENTLFSTMVGHILANREPAMFASYEAFLNIITSQVIQHLKFLEQANATSWREKYPATNILSTSTCWRQDHNGFSHQSPALISTVLDIPDAPVNCLFPVDDVASAAAFDFMMNSKNVVNITTVNKTNEPRWIDINHAKFQFENGGASLFGFASDDGEPDYIFAAAGDIATREAIFAMRIIKSDLPGIKLRFVGINALSYGAIGTTDNRLTEEKFNELFGQEKPIILNFHGFRDTLRNIFTNYTNQYRLRPHGFIEKGSTTTPFEMLSLNHASRYDLALDIAKDLGRKDLIEKYQDIIIANSAHADAYGVDLPELGIIL